jgi:hypothetical protein
LIVDCALAAHELKDGFIVLAVRAGIGISFAAMPPRKIVG